MMSKEDKAVKARQYRKDNIESIKRYDVKRDTIRNVIRNPATNAKRMTVNGKYVSRKHPLWKIGNYKSFNDAAFSSFVNYNKTTKGDVYLITNDAWPEWIKVGKAGDAADRLKNYQTSDPFRAYKLQHSITLENRHTGEVKAHKELEALSTDRKNEWFKVDLTVAVNCIEAL